MCNYYREIIFNQRWLNRFEAFFCTILTSDSELIDSTYMVTPTSTGGPAIWIVNNVLFGFVALSLYCRLLVYKICNYRDKESDDMFIFDFDFRFSSILKRFYELWFLQVVMALNMIYETKYGLTKNFHGNTTVNAVTNRIRRIKKVCFTFELYY